MTQNYQRLRGLIIQVRAASSVAEVEAISW
jgi:hypothetical protein